MTIYYTEAEEALIKTKNLAALRVTPADVDAAIDPAIPAAYHIFPGTTTTVCLLTLRNGYTVTGESATVSLANFDKEIGEEVAYKAARDKIWPLLGYALREQLS